MRAVFMILKATSRVGPHSRVLLVPATASYSGARLSAVCMLDEAMIVVYHS